MPELEHPHTHEILSEILHNLWEAQGHLRGGEPLEAEMYINRTVDYVRSELDCWANGTSGPAGDDEHHESAVDGHDEATDHQACEPREKSAQEPPKRSQQGYLRPVPSRHEPDSGSEGV